MHATTNLDNNEIREHVKGLLLNLTTVYQLNIFTTSNVIMIKKDVKESSRVLILRYYPSICVEILRKTTKSPSSIYSISGLRIETETSRVTVTRLSVPQLSEVEWDDDDDDESVISYWSYLRSASHSRIQSQVYLTEQETLASLWRHKVSNGISIGLSISISRSVRH